MKSLKSSIAVFLACLLAVLSFSLPVQAVMLVNFGGAAGPSYLATESFDTNPGYDRTWTVVTGTPDPDNTATVLEGTQSLFIGARANAANQELYTTFTPTDGQPQEVYFLIRYEFAGTIVTDYNVAILKDAAANNVARLYLNRSAGGLKFKILAQGGTSATTVGTITDNTTAHIWLRYLKGTGLNAFASIGFSTNGVRPTSGDNNYAESTNGTSTANAARLYFTTGYTSATNSCDFRVDKVRIDDATIGDNPQ